MSFLCNTFSFLRIPFLNMKYKYIEVLLFLLLAISCEEKVTVDIKKKQNALNVDGFISDRLGYNYIKLYKVQDYNSNKTDSISGAEVFIVCGNDTAKFVEKNRKGYYTNETFKGKAGLTYKLLIIANKKHYEASSELVKIKSRFSLEYSISENDEINVKYINDSVRFRYLIYRNDSLKEGLEWFWIIPMYAYRGDVFPIKFYKNTKTIKVERQSLDTVVHNYFKELYKYMQRDISPFTNPPDFPQGNISNGAVGIFRASSVSTREIIIKH